ncbi:MAG: ABC transporter permease [Bradyrhizobium sp.]|nr:ABC transporter permease [Bradyrhizobium sp.]
MKTFVSRRLIGAVPVLFGVSLVVFFLIHIIPGDITSTLLGPMATENAKAMLRQALGLNQPLAVQYLKWLGTVLSGNLGTSIATSVPVSTLVFPRFLNTAILALASLLLSLLVGYSAGIFSAARAQSVFDRAAMTATLIFGSIPPYWLALVLVMVFALRLRWLPATGMTGIISDGGALDVLRHLVLPAIATAAAPAAIITRMVRASMIEVINQDYIRVLRAKGIPRRVILRRHVLRNALPPIATITGLQLGYLLGGALFTEVVFAWPGLGNQLYSSILARDTPVVQAAVLLIALMFVLVNLAVDILNAFLDPRIRIS